MPIRRNWRKRWEKLLAERALPQTGSKREAEGDEGAQIEAFADQIVKEGVDISELSDETLSKLYDEFKLQMVLTDKPKRAKLEQEARNWVRAVTSSIIGEAAGPSMMEQIFPKVAPKKDESPPLRREDLIRLRDSFKPEPLQPNTPIFIGQELYNQALEQMDRRARESSKIKYEQTNVLPQPYDVPITSIIEADSMKELAAAEDRAFLKRVIAAELESQPPPGDLDRMFEDWCRSQEALEYPR